MAKGYKNFWSLNVDEAVVTGILRDETDKGIEVFMPLNAQMKDVDLLLMNLKNNKFVTIQVKGSKAYEPSKKQIVDFREGSGGWFFLQKDIVNKSSADYFIFLVYVIEQLSKAGRMVINPHTIIIPTKEIQKLVKENKKPHPDRYSFYFWVNPKEKRAFDFRDTLYDVSEYLDEKGFKKLNEKLK